MGFFKNLDMLLQKDLIDFVKEEEERKGKTLADCISCDILQKIINGDCKITGCATDHDKKKMFIEYTFYSEEKSNGND